MDTNVNEEKQSNKRYLVTMSYYLHSPDAETAKKEAIALAAGMNKQNDCQASVNEMWEKPFGKQVTNQII